VSAGLPGIGLAGLFFIASALFAPLWELVLTARGRSSPERWARVWRQFAMALAMLASIQVSLAILSVAIGVSPLKLSAVPAISLALLALVVGAAKAAALVGGRRGRKPALLRRLRWALLGSNQ
jgi:hypothetical protein